MAFRSLNTTRVTLFSHILQIFPKKFCNFSHKYSFDLISVDFESFPTQEYPKKAITIYCNITTLYFLSFAVKIFPNAPTEIPYARQSRSEPCFHPFSPLEDENFHFAFIFFIPFSQTKPMNRTHC